MDIVINGRGLDRPINGIPRYMREILLNMDHLIKNQKYNIEVVIPSNSNINIIFNNLKLIKLRNRYFWDFICAEKYAKRKSALYINLASKGILYKNSVSTIHDIRVLREKTDFNYRALKTEFKIRLSYFWAVKNARRIVTVSEFSKAEIVKYYNILPDKIEVIGNGWEHIKRIKCDETIFDEYPEIKKGNYFFSVGSIAPHKNFKWIIENKRYYPEVQFVIVGKLDPSIWDVECRVLKNIIYVGYQSDERMFALMKSARALIFPSVYEGFGIPPLEALACGIPVIVADIPVMHEIFRDSAVYIDKDRYDIDIRQLLKKRVEPADKILKEHSWRESAQNWLKLIEKMGEE